MGALPRAPPLALAHKNSDNRCNSQVLLFTALAPARWVGVLSCVGCVCVVCVCLCMVCLCSVCVCVCVVYVLGCMYVCV